MRSILKIRKDMKMYDEIEFFRRGKSLYKTCLPEGSNAELRKAIAKHGGIEGVYDRFVIITDGKIRVDSEKEDVLKEEMNIFRYYIISCIGAIIDGKKLKNVPEKDRYKKFWGTINRGENELLIKDLETGTFYRSGYVELDRGFYDKLKRA